MAKVLTLKGLIFFVALFLVGITEQLHAQDFRLKFNRIGIKDGLSNSSITSIVKDNKGFVWIGTEDGLNLYDGYSFRIFKYQPDNKHSISSNSVQNMVCTKQNVWVGTINGMNRYDRDHDRFERFTIGNSYTENCVTTIAEVKDKYLWIGTYGGLKQINLQTNKVDSLWTVKGLGFNLKKSLISELIVDKFGYLWIGAEIKTETSKRSVLVRVDLQSMNGEIVYNDLQTTSILVEDKNTVWIGTMKGLLRYDYQHKTETKFSNTPNDDNTIIGDQIDALTLHDDGNLWIGTPMGLSILDRKTMKFHNFAPVQGDDRSLSSSSVKLIFDDDAGMTWLGTRQGGICTYNKRESKFKHFKNEPSNPNSLSGNIVGSIVEDAQHRIWIATDGGGLNCFDRATNNFTCLKNIPGNSNSLSSNKVLCLYLDHNDGLWIGMWEGGLDYYNLKNQKFTHYKNIKGNANSLPGNNIFNINEDSQGTIWISVWSKGICSLDPKTQKFGQLSSKSTNELKELMSSTVVVIYFDRDKNMWLGAERNGLFKYSPKTQVISHYVNNQEILKSLSGKNVYSIFQDSKDRIWIGVAGGSLDLYHPDEDNFSHYTVADGLPSDGIDCIQEDKKGKLWVSTNNGVSCISLSQSQKKLHASFHNYTAEDGLQGSQFARWAGAKSSTGEIYFGGINGFNIIDPEHIDTNPFLPPVVITNFQIHYKSVNPDSIGSPITKNISETQAIELNHTQNVITFEFAALAYNHPEKNQYAFFMEGFDADWHFVGNQRKATYTNLSPGEYTFYIKASNNDGVWNNTGTKIKIKVLPPWWRTWWFMSFSFILVVGSVGSYFMMKIRATRIQNQKLERLVKERTSELSNAYSELKEKQDEIMMQNEEIKQQSEELETQKGTLEIQNKALNVKNEMINSSIRYANTIQQAILPDLEKLRTFFECSILYLPKDVVSGDFYWCFELPASSKNQKEFIVAVADCTGHGVPGALMSMIGSSLLHEIIHEYPLFSPAEILEELDKRIFASLRQDTTANTDGMDIVLCKISFEDERERKITFSGARNPFYYKKAPNTEIDIIKGDHAYIGGRRIHQISKHFTNTEIQLAKGDQIYLLTDGIIDQNNFDRKRFGTKRLLDTLITVAEEDVDSQIKALWKSLNEWMDCTVQRDDITVLAIKL